MSKSERRAELSAMNVLLCLLVIFIHVASKAISSADRASWQFALLLPGWRFCAFAVQGFVFLAGVKLALSLDKPFSYPRYLARRCLRVLLPYIAAIAAYYVYFILRGYYEFDLSYFLHELLTGGLSGHFYFVILIFQFYLTAPLWRALAKRLDSAERIIGVLIAALFISLLYGQYLIDFLYIFNKSYVFPYCDRIFTTYLFYWTAGLAVGRHYERVKSAAADNLRQLMVLFVFAAAGNGLLSWIHFSGRESVYFLETAHRFYIITAIMFVFAAAVRYGEKIAALKPLRLLDHASYQIYLWHPLALHLSEQLLEGRGISIGAEFIVRMLFGYVLTIAVCAPAVWAVEKLKLRRTIKEK